MLDTLQKKIESLRKTIAHMVARYDMYTDQEIELRKLFEVDLKDRDVITIGKARRIVKDENN